MNRIHYEYDIYKVKQGEMSLINIIPVHGFYNIKKDIMHHLITLKVGILEYDTSDNNSQFRLREEYLKLYNELKYLYPQKEYPEKWL